MKSHTISNTFTVNCFWFFCEVCSSKFLLMCVTSEAIMVDKLSKLEISHKVFWLVLWESLGLL